MTDPNRWPSLQRRKVVYAAGATLLAFAEITWLLPAAHAPHAPLLARALMWLGLALTALLVLLALAARGSGGERPWLW